MLDFQKEINNYCNILKTSVIRKNYKQIVKKYDYFNIYKCESSTSIRYYIELFLSLYTLLQNFDRM